MESKLTLSIANRRNDFKSQRRSFLQENRDRFLSKQRDRRSDVVDSIRKLSKEKQTNESELMEDTIDTENKQIDEVIQEEKENMMVETEHKDYKRKYYESVGTRDFYAKQLQTHDWLIDLPNFDDWFVLARPQGHRCLVIAAHGETVSRKRNGTVLHRFPSALPCGSRKTKAGKNELCILDCIFCESSSVYYVLDMMCWKNYALYDSTFDFRSFWIDSKLPETNAGVLSTSNPFPFLALPRELATVDSISQFYQNQDTIQDGLIFIHKDSPYALEINPLVLQWKDSHCSKFPVDEALLDNRQMLTLYQENNNLVTLDKLPVGIIESEMNIDTVSNPEVKDSEVLKVMTCSLAGLNSGSCLDLTFHGKSRSKRIPDTWSRIVFQYRMKNHSNITIQNILSLETYEVNDSNEIPVPVQAHYVPLQI